MDISAVSLLGKMGYGLNFMDKVNNYKGSEVVILNWFPPTKVSWPSPASSVLSDSLRKSGIKCFVIYWNIILEDILSSYLFEKNMENMGDEDFLQLFYAYIALQRSDEDLLSRQECYLRQRKPQYTINGFDFRLHIEKYCALLDDKIREVLLSFPSVLFHGMSLHLFQWVAATVVASISKNLSPNIPISVGGIGNRRMAEAFLRNFPQFDYAMWGEGEYSIVKLAACLLNDEPVTHIPHIVYRLNDTHASGIERYHYAPLIEVNFDFSDFFTHYKGKKEHISLPIERSRGCHWNKCRFCFLNDGYKYRVKSPAHIASEIRSQISRYQVYKFHFLDNDLIGNSLEEFRELLSALIQIRDEYPMFKIELAEIITKGITRDIIRDMSLAGLCHVQIGYESASDNLLNKIRKKNTFASNLLFIKWAYHYSISLGGVNIIRGLLEETDSDILEAVKNLTFLRFFLDPQYCKHSITSLAISTASQYYPEVTKDGYTNYDLYVDRLKENLPKDYVHVNDWFSIYQLIGLKQNSSWNAFAEVERYLLKANMSYKLTKKCDSILYQEFIGHEETRAILFTQEEIEWKILEATNNEVRNRFELMEALGTNEERFNTALQELIGVNLVYYSEVHQEVVSIINIDTVL